ncbi:MAG: aldehyde ferredoxin oxidoreductase N-terminal domain-containing protein [Chloroflexota bacterium]|nr:aldehyde ferredoxin oxidoreductase N-terminal domain-containing protein [Chloroflexota bacterium]
MNLPGYAGHILYVDLTNSRITKESLDRELAADFLGGWGINGRLAYNHIPPHTESLSPENAIIVGTGPFSGTIVLGSAELVVPTKLPLSGGIGTACGGGHFPIMLKTCGYDHIVISGRASKPVYLEITSDDVTLCDASNLWGLDAYETVDELRPMYEPCSIIPIGPSGENMGRISMTFIDKGGTLGFGGLAAVVGSKNLKAMVACQGDKGIQVADHLRLQKAVDQMIEEVVSYRLRPQLLEGVTFSMTSKWLEGMGMPIAGWDDIHRRCRKTLACPSCPMGDKEINRLTEGEHAPLVAYLTDFMAETEASTESALDNHNRAVKRLAVFNRNGICRSNFYNVMNLMVSLYDQGIITKEDTGGIEIKQYYDTVLQLIGMTAHREGFGDIMAEGPLASQKIGRGAKV